MINKIMMVNTINLIVLNLLITANALVYDKCINDKHLTLTFDDGPNENTINLINILDKYKIKGTFFINGLNIIRNNYQSLIKSMYTNNHIIGSHGFAHAAMEQINDFNKRRELSDNELVFRQLFNKRPYYYRPPYFSYDASVVAMTETFGYSIIATNLNTNDWKATSSDEIYNNFVNGLISNNGSIILQHDYQVLSNDALVKIIDYGILNNYTFVSLDVCIGVNKIYNDDNKYGPNLLNGI